MSGVGTQWGPYGQPAIASEFTWGGFGPGMGLLYFTGLAFVLPTPRWLRSAHISRYRNTYIKSLSGTFGSYTNLDEPTSVVHPITVVKYEKHVPTSPDTQSTVGLSKFALWVAPPPIVPHTDPTSATSPHQSSPSWPGLSAFDSTSPKPSSARYHFSPPRCTASSAKLQSRASTCPKTSRSTWPP